MLKYVKIQIFKNFHKKRNYLHVPSKNSFKTTRNPPKNQQKVKFRHKNYLNSSRGKKSSKFVSKSNSRAVSWSIFLLSSHNTQKKRFFASSFFALLLEHFHKHHFARHSTLDFLARRENLGVFVEILRNFETFL